MGSFCPECGSKLHPDAAFCKACGAKLSASAPEPVAPAKEPALPVPQPPSLAQPTAALAPQHAAPPRDNTTTMYAVVAIVAALALIGGALVLTGGSDDPGTAAGEVFLEPADAPGEHPFTEDLDTNTAPPPVRLASATLPASESPASESPGRAAIRSVEGVAPGLYGGTQDDSACDAKRLVEFLQSDTAKAKAWAAAQGITPDAIPAFVADLTPMVLRADTRVTNHGYTDGRATPLQSILQAGTAVLVDNLGQPRVKCSCGNPLAPPTPQREGVRYTGDKWPGFQPATTIVVVNTKKKVVNNFVVVNLVFPGFFIRDVGSGTSGSVPPDRNISIDTFCDLFPDDCRPPDLSPGGDSGREGEPALGTGDVQATLRWNSTADLDLGVLDPNGNPVDFDNPSSSSGGQLDVDSNADCSNPTNAPVENIFWPQGESPDGEYTFVVTYFRECEGGTGPQDFELTVLMGGVPVSLDAQVSQLSPGSGSTAILLAGKPGRSLIAQASSTGTLSPGEKYVATATKEGSTLGNAPHAPQDVSASASLYDGDGAGLFINWLPSFDEDSGIETSFEITIEPGGTTLVVTFDTPGVMVPLDPGVEYTISVVAVNAAGKSPPSTVTGTTSEQITEPEEAPPAPPEPETLEQYCDRMYPPPPSSPAENPMWTLCMHDPTSDDVVDQGSLPVPVDA